MGTVLGVGAFVAILGLTSTASNQISAAFSTLSATSVTVNDVGAQPGFATVDSFPEAADQVVAGLAGVVHVGRTWNVDGAPLAVATSLDPRAIAHPLTVSAASVGYLAALGPRLASGALFNSFHDNNALAVAVLGGAAARQLGITSVVDRPAIFVRGVAFTVVGILNSVDRQPDTMLSVLIPARTAQRYFGEPKSSSPSSMLIATSLGAAQLIARQAPIALRPDRKGLLRAVPPPDPRSLRDDVTNSLNSLFVLFAAMTLFLGAVGIASTTLVAALERGPEIGLRRALGARPRDISLQFVVESSTIGTLGGLVGAALGVIVVLAVAVAQSWTAILNTEVTLLAPLLGTASGLLAGLYPARRAARVEPVSALRR